MNSFNQVAHVSAVEYPHQGLIHKRHFEPINHSIFSDAKKRKLDNGIQKLQPSFISDASFNTFLNTTEGSSHNWSTPQKTPGSSFLSSNFLSESKNRSDSEKRCLEIEENGCSVKQRYKFKARPIPKTQYKVSFIPKTNERMPTIPQEFPLSTPSPHRYRQQSEKPETFRARPMPNFSYSWLPQSSFTPGKSSNPLELNLESEFLDTTPGYFSIHTPPAKRFHTPTKSRHSERNLTPSHIYTSGYNFSKSKDSYTHHQKYLRDFEPTIPMEIELHTAKRAQEREIFEEQLREKQRLKQALERVESEEKAKIEAKEIKMIRKQSEFKARPMPNYRHKSPMSRGSQSVHSDDMMDIE
ncbi:hypothetical protein SteCoe_12522 [Stentor coeruleus]|uniref:TPX2 C-terminal domain-containing protein n=1 Tax=Stentor coeruleus TaxID=5963 RepID=A0A1R2CAJ2_9CILI|nr:hypothetical protein SteCoe_12522 [Stentor coeruleus]